MIAMQPIVKESPYATGKDILALSGVNISPEQAKANILANLALGLQEVRPHIQQDVEIMLLCGGPSLNDFKDEIIDRRRAGMPLVTTNGAYNWCLENWMTPGAQIILDGRAFNKRFVTPVVDGCKYLLASQCDPELVKSCPPEQTWLWHCGEADGVTEALNEFDDKRGVGRHWYPVYGSMTVMLRAIPLLIMLGYNKYHIYGFDSCLRDDNHHAYAQPENDCEDVMEVRCTNSDRPFKCHSWMVSQAQQFIDIQPMIRDLCEMVVYGDGLIAHIINTGAKLARKEH